jgi:CHAT domain-containing protein
MAREAFRHFRKLKTNYEAAKSLVNEAIALGRQGNGPAALKQFKKAGQAFKADKNRVWPRLIELYQAVVLFHEGKYSEAQRYCSGTVAFFDGAAMPGKAVLAYLLLARIAFLQKDLDTASLHIEKALLRLKTFDSSELDCQAHFLRGQIAAARGDSPAAYAAYREALRRLESLRSGLSSEDLKISFMKNRLEVYEKLIALLLAGTPGEGGPEEIFSYMQAAKSRSMTEIISQGGSRLASPNSQNPELTRQIHQMRQDLNWYYHRIEIEQLGADAVSPERVERLRKKANSLETDFVRALRELPPSLRGTEVEESPVQFPVEAIQATLGRDCTMLEYFSVGNQLVVAVLTPRDMKVIPLGRVDAVRGLMHSLQFQLGKFRFGRNEYLQDGPHLLQAIHGCLAALYAQLIAPVEPLLQSSHLVIAPHGLLHYLPFHALRCGEEYLSDRMSISYAPSATVFAQCQLRPSRPIRSSLILGIPDDAAPLIEAEVRMLQGILPQPKLYLGASADIGVLRDEGPRHDLLHISTHGSFRQDNPMFSSIKLGDGPLNLYDLYQLHFDSTLVALSGCSTGMNVVAPGDELLGLQRGLLYAGAGSVLLSLWDVNDESTAQLMTAFYRRLVAGKEPAEALQGAMQEIRTAYPHPYYWAPFMLAGRYSIGE